jgi:hypothetical protein
MLQQYKVTETLLTTTGEQHQTPETQAAVRRHDEMATHCQTKLFERSGRKKK